MLMIWYLFGIDLLRKKCYVIQTIKNSSSETSFFDIKKGRSFWSELLKEDTKLRSSKKIKYSFSINAENKEWNSFCFNQYNVLKNKRITDPWLNEGYELDQEGNNNEHSSDDDNYLFIQEENSQEIEEFSDFDNFWNQEGVFEKMTDLKRIILIVRETF